MQQNRWHKTERLIIKIHTTQRTVTWMGNLGQSTLNHDHRTCVVQEELTDLWTRACSTRRDTNVKTLYDTWNWKRHRTNCSGCAALVEARNDVVNYESVSPYWRDDEHKNNVSTRDLNIGRPALRQSCYWAIKTQATVIMQRYYAGYFRKLPFPKKWLQNTKNGRHIQLKLQSAERNGLVNTLRLMVRQATRAPSCSENQSTSLGKMNFRRII
jgi:hypothetical protein